MKERGLLLTPDNRQRSREGLKTNTRRVPKWPKGWESFICHHVTPLENGSFSFWSEDGSSFNLKPRYQVGDHLYMLEPIFVHFGMFGKELGTQFGYIEAPEEKLRTVHVSYDYDKSYRPASRMPKYAARTWFEVTGVRCERVRSISLDDIIAEGVRLPQEAKRVASIMTEKGIFEALAKPAFKELWDSINAKPKPVYAKKVLTHYVSYPWDDTGKWAKMKTYRGKPHYCYPNPWNFVYEYKLIEREC